MSGQIVDLEGIPSARPAMGETYRPVGPLNPCELEIDLFCLGMRIAPSCTIDGDARPIVRTRAGLGSGLELVIPGPLKNVWVNVPVVEAFAQNSPYLLTDELAAYSVLDTRAGHRYPVLLPPEPAWYRRETSRGIPMPKVGVLQGTYLAIYLSKSCEFWQYSENCAFCSTGLNVGANEHSPHNIDDVVEVALAAKRESGCTFVHFNSGYQSGRELDEAAPFVKAVKSQVGMLVGLQMIPTLDFWKYDRLIDLGVDHFSFCYEFHNPVYFARHLPGKQRYIGQQTFFRALEYTSKKMAKGACSGEIIAGIEPLTDTLRAIDYIAGLGAFPTVCIFRPTVGSKMEHASPPRYEDMLAVFRHVYEACRRNRIPMDVVPNIEVSLVVQPGDTRYLAHRSLSSTFYQARMSVMRRLARPYFAWKMRPKGISASGVLTPG